MEGGDESSKITDHSATEREDGSLAVQSQSDQAVAESRGNGHRLGGFTGRDFQKRGAESRGSQGMEQSLRVEWGDGGIRDDGACSRCHDPSGECSGLSEQSLPDQDLVG
jgi:hypothetical protein